jgi:hypothetical protein
MKLQPAFEPQNRNYLEDDVTETKMVLLEQQLQLPNGSSTRISTPA